jgi:hypothetical protein
MDRETTLLVHKIRELESLFRSYAIDHWADWLEQVARLISSDDLEGIDHLLSAYGGMGSMSDVFISRQAGDPVEARDTSRVNSEVRALRSSIYELATSIRSKQQ